MFFWSVTFLMRTPEGSVGSHTFVVEADSYQDARHRALRLADEPASRDRRRGASLDLDSLTVNEILPF